MAARETPGSPGHRGMEMADKGVVALTTGEVVSGEKDAAAYVEPAPLHAFQKHAIPRTGCLRRRWDGLSTQGKACVACAAVLATAFLALGITALVWYFTIYIDPPVDLPPPCEQNCTKVDHSLWADVLRKYTEKTKLAGTPLVGVRYGAIPRGPNEKLDKYVAMIGDLDFGGLASLDALAVCINAYNAWTVWLITENAGVKSINDLGEGCVNGRCFRPVWKRQFATLNRQKVSLDQIEHEIIRKRWNKPEAGFTDPARVHAAVNCASISCPDLRQEPYQEPGLDLQLDNATKHWLSSKEKGLYAMVESNRVSLNPIMATWYPADFTRDSPDGTLRGWVARHMDQVDPATAGFLRESLPKITAMNYDWNLNLYGAWGSESAAPCPALARAICVVAAAAAARLL